MSDEHASEYQSAVLAVAMCGKMLAQHDLPKLLEAIERAEVVGPFLDPTLYRAKAQAMAEDRKAIEAAIPLRALFASALPCPNCEDHNCTVHASK